MGTTILTQTVMLLSQYYSKKFTRGFLPPGLKAHPFVSHQNPIYPSCF